MTTVKKDQGVPQPLGATKLSWEEWYPSVNPKIANRMTSGPVVIAIILIALGVMAVLGNIWGL